MRAAPQTYEFTERQRPMCGEWMLRAKELCARRPDHGYEHRSAYAMANARRMENARRKGLAA